MTADEAACPGIRIHEASLDDHEARRVYDARCLCEELGFALAIERLVLVR